MRHGLNVLWVNATANATEVIQFKVLRNGPDTVFVHDPMCL